MEALRVRGLRAWPGLQVDAADFLAFVSRQFPDGGTADEVQGLSADGLVLACACAKNDPYAIGVFENLFGREIRTIVARMGVAPGTSRDVEQKILIRLFVGNKPRPPKIADYKGRGSLRAWLRTLATRVALDELAATSTHELLTDLFLMPGGDPEIEYFKKFYGAEFQEAFTAARATLSARELNLVKQYFNDGMTIDQLAAFYGIHRATAARHVNAVRDHLLDETRRQLTMRLNIDEEMLSSILRLIASRMHEPE